MRFLITAQPGPNSHHPGPNDLFDEKLFVAYMKYNEEMHKAGVLVAAEGLNPEGKGARIEVKDGKRVVVDGPFAEAKELVGGFYVVEVGSLEEAVAWALRCPTGMGFDDIQEIRPLTTDADLPPHLLDLIRQSAPEWSRTLIKEK
ncbi:MAG: YciI family protein [Thermoanaerobaculia bacterium]